MKYLEIPIPIPKNVYTDTTGAIKGSYTIHGRYNLYLKTPLGTASEVKWFIEKVLHNVITVGDSYILMEKVEEKDDGNVLKIQVVTGAPPLILVLGAIAAVGVVLGLVLVRVEKVFRVAAPYVLAGGLIFIPEIRRPLIGGIKSSVKAIKKAV